VCVCRPQSRLSAHPPRAAARPRACALACALRPNLSQPHVCVRMHTHARTRTHTHTRARAHTHKHSSSCAMLMAYPDGVLQVKCPGCGTVNNTPPVETTMHIGAAAGNGGGLMVSCFACTSQVQCPPGALSAVCSVCDTPNEILTCQNATCSGRFSCSGQTPVACPVCSTVANPPRQAGGGGGGASAFIHVSCLGCGCRLQMPANAPAVSCPRCTFVTQAADPRAKASALPYAPSSMPQPQPAHAPDGRARASAQTEEAAIEEAIRRSLGQVVCSVASLCLGRGNLPRDVVVPVCLPRHVWQPRGTNSLPSSLRSPPGPRAVSKSAEACASCPPCSVSAVAAPAAATTRAECLWGTRSRG
jgi:LSD1 subclass zinc finger protein